MADYPHLSASYRLHDGPSETRRTHRREQSRVSQEDAELTALAAPAPAAQREQRRRGSFEERELNAQRSTRVAQRNSNDNRERQESGEAHELTELSAPAPSPLHERRRNSFEDRETALRRDTRSSKRTGHDEQLTVAAAASPAEEKDHSGFQNSGSRSASDEETPSPTDTNGKSDTPAAEGRAGWANKAQSGLD